ncbi:MAG: NADH-quinone oxidoreductase subunit J [Chloroflexi bacterium]|nr:NADH-quinone oxidoreductase subunit J [Chloroflexota bacterium]
MESIFFYATAAIALIGAIGMVLSRNAIHSALFLVLNFAATSVLYLMLNAPLLAVLQVTVYAGAIMVLFLFVIMLLNAENVSVDSHLRWQPIAALILGGLLLVETVVTVGRPLPLNPAGVTPETLNQLADPRVLAQFLFTDYLLPFEVTSLLLLVAMVGAVVLTKARPAQKRDQRRVRFADQVEGSEGASAVMSEPQGENRPVA